MDNKLSQLSMNFIILLGILLVTFFVFSLIYVEQMNKLSKKQEYMLIEDMANSLRKELLIAVDTTDGYHREFYIKSTLDGINYGLAINGTFLYLNTSREDILLKIPDVIGTFKDGLNRIEKKNGQIYLK